MFGTLPSWGFYCRHVRGLKFTNLHLSTAKPDLRHAMLFDDAEDIQIDGLSAPVPPGAAPMVSPIDDPEIVVQARRADR